MGFQARPDDPRCDASGKPVKYETPTRMKMALDVHPFMLPRIRNNMVPLIVTEGIRKADAAVSVLGLPAIGLLGVWIFRGTNDEGGKTLLAVFESIAFNDRDVFIAYDSDAMSKLEVHHALSRLGEVMKSRQAHVHYVYLPDGDVGQKIGLDDFLRPEHQLSDIRALSTQVLRQPAILASPKATPREEVPPTTLSTVADEFQSWLQEPDIDAVIAVMAAVVANRAEGDPVWLLVVGPPSSGKTEIIMPLILQDDCYLTSRLTEAGLLSVTFSEPNVP